MDGVTQNTMRELFEADLVAASDGVYGLTDSGRSRVEEMA